MKHYKAVEILSIFSVKPPEQTQSPTAETQSPPIENILTTVLNDIISLRKLQVEIIGTNQRVNCTTFGNINYEITQKSVYQA